RMITLVPLILVITFILRVAAPAIDNYYSARPVARDLETKMAHYYLDGKPVPPKAPVAVFDTCIDLTPAKCRPVKRELRYGLAFYRNQRIMSYYENEVPTTGHLLIARTGMPPQIAQRTPNPSLAPIDDGFVPQELEYFWVSGLPPKPAPPA